MDDNLLVFCHVTSLQNFLELYVDYSYLAARKICWPTSSTASNPPPQTLACKCDTSASGHHDALSEGLVAPAAGSQYSGSMNAPTAQRLSTGSHPLSLLELKKRKKDLEHLEAH
jgi:hypothetical protein